MKIITNQQLEAALFYPILIEALRFAFCENITLHQYDNPKANIESTLLLMPAWKIGEYLGVKNRHRFAQ